ncbi:hypothetical protein [Rhodoferax sp.]|uniref:hypothetical protein n=1 Tax=Rhodoferax sp. TaxID=50421 RepID=UPI00271D6947|nr:hypothetical protein [Rhodoferax sp.]MDO9198593.1 hypothetical protein [Rhodoferax sp.]
MSIFLLMWGAHPLFTIISVVLICFAVYFLWRGFVIRALVCAVIAFGLGYWAYADARDNQVIWRREPSVLIPKRQ